MISYLFPGQGSQTKGMGGDLFNEFHELSALADDILGYSIAELCLADSQQQLNFTQFTQPALYVVNALSYYKQLNQNPIKPHFVAGHSLGEYNALLAADVFDFATGLKLVKKRGELMSKATEGAMAAVIGLQVEKIKQLLQEHDLNQVAIANDNSHTQVVVSGLAADVAKVKLVLEQAGARLVVPLKVSGAFHSPYMQAAQVEFATYLSAFNFSMPTIPVIANITAKPYVTSELQNNIIQQITHSVRWTESMEYLIAQGVTDFVEVGPGTVLTGLIKRIRNGQ